MVHHNLTPATAKHHIHINEYYMTVKTGETNN